MVPILFYLQMLSILSLFLNFQDQNAPTGILCLKNGEAISNRCLQCTSVNSVVSFLNKSFFSPQQMRRWYRKKIRK